LTGVGIGAMPAVGPTMGVVAVTEGVDGEAAACRVSVAMGHLTTAASGQ